MHEEENSCLLLLMLCQMFTFGGSILYTIYKVVITFYFPLLFVH